VISDKFTPVSLDSVVHDNEETKLESVVNTQKEKQNVKSIDKTVDAKLVLNSLGKSRLTRREKQVLDLSLKGMTVREIGVKLGVSHVRVIKLKQHIKEKYNKVTGTV
jgi:DNA-binding CsgD family transcriptional regulator